MNTDQIIAAATRFVYALITAVLRGPALWEDRRDGRTHGN